MNFLLPPGIKEFKWLSKDTISFYFKPQAKDWPNIISKF